MQQEEDFYYEIIYLFEKDNIVYNNKTFADILTDYASSNIINNLGPDFFHEVENYLPYLTINMPDLDDRLTEEWLLSEIPDVITIFENDLKKFILFNGNEPEGVEHTLQGIEYLEPYLPNRTLGIGDAEVHYLVNSNGEILGGGNLRNTLPSGPGITESNITDCINYLISAIKSLDIYTQNGNEWYLLNHDRMLELYAECLIREAAPDDIIDPRTQECALCPRDCEEELEHIVRYRLDEFDVLRTIRNQVLENRYVFHSHTTGAFVNSEGSLSPFDMHYVSGSKRKRDLFENCADGGLFGSGNGVCDGVWIEDNYQWWAADWKLTNVAEPVRTDWSEVDDMVVETSFSYTLGFSFTGPSVNGASSMITNALTVGFQITGEETVNLGSQVTNLCTPAPLTNLSTGSIIYQQD